MNAKQVKRKFATNGILTVGHIIIELQSLFLFVISNKTISIWLNVNFSLKICLIRFKIWAVFLSSLLLIALNFFGRFQSRLVPQSLLIKNQISTRRIAKRETKHRLKESKQRKIEETDFRSLFNYSRFAVISHPVFIFDLSGKWLRCGKQRSWKKPRTQQD